MSDVPSRLAEDIDEVIEVLDDVVAWALRGSHRLGYFAALYRAVTAKVRDGIAEGFFDDGERMARLDVVFANRYLAALDALRTGDDPTRSWQLTFDAAGRRTPTVLQHLLVGINAHINLDLGVAAAQVAPGEELAGLRRDFDRINEILGSMVARTQEDLAAISPWLGLLDVLGGRTDDEVVRFSIEVARTQAWWFATELSRLERDHWAAPIAARDGRVVRVGRTVLRPGALTPVLALIRLRESKDVRRNLQLLARVRPPDLGEVESRVRREATSGLEDRS